jgi:hypothetical protein
LYEIVEVTPIDASHAAQDAIHAITVAPEEVGQRLPIA